MNTYELVAELIEAGKARVRGALEVAGNLTVPGWTLSKPSSSMSQAAGSTNSFTISTATAGHLASNAYYTAADQWYRYDVGQTAMVVVFHNNGSILLYYATAGANPIAWSKASMRLGNVADADTTWVTPSFQNSWASYSSPYAAAYRKLPSGMVILRGLIAGGGQNTIAFTLPAGYRPANTMHGQYLFATPCITGMVRNDVYSNGNVHIGMEVKAGTWGNGWVSLDGMTFLAEA